MTQSTTPKRNGSRSRLRGALALACLVAILIGPRAASARSPGFAASEGPEAQLTDKLEGPDRSLFVALYSTELNEEGAEASYEFEGAIHKLPCPGSGYRFVATDSSINESRASTTEAEVRVVSAHLPRGIRCGAALAGYLVEGGATIKLAPSVGRKSLPAVYRDPPEKITVESLGNCATLDEVCAGSYKLTATFEAPGHRLTVGYDVVVTRARSKLSRGSAPAPCLPS